MSDVACRALDVFFTDARRRGIPADDLLRGVDVPLSLIRDRRHRIPWATFVRILDNLARHYTPAELESLGGAYLRSPLIRPFALVAGLVFKARDFYKWIYAPNSPVQSVFSCVTPTFDERSPSEAFVTLTLAPGLEPSEPFNHISRGAVVDLARLAGAPPAVVTLESLPNGARYAVHFSDRGGRLAWLRKAIAWPFTVFSAGRALKEAHEDLRERYFELDSAKQLVAAQATQLQTAHTISQVVHADLDLGRTLDAVAEAFISIAQFRGACVSLDGTAPREATRGTTEGQPDLLRTLEAQGRTIGQLALWYDAGADPAERGSLVDTVTPTVALALHGAISHAELLDAQVHLERRVVERTAELSTARDKLAHTIVQLETAEEARTRIFANVNHELRTPLTLILLSIEELRRGGGVSATDERGLAAVGRNARKLLRLVDNLLLLAAGDEDKLTISPERTDVAELVAAVVDGFGASARACEIQLRAEATPGLFAEVDVVAVDRILSNLVSNAIKFTPAGGTIVAGAAVDGDHVVLTVRDSGVGISEAFAGRIFGRFEQDAKPVRPGSAGSGIGLSIVRSLAEAHLGTAVVERLSPGTLFRVTLPLVASARIKRAEAAPGRPRLAAPSDFGLPALETPMHVAPTGVREHTVLVVEDNDELRAHIVEILSAHHHVRFAVNGEEGLALADAHRPDMLVTDIGLPGMDGLELTRRFRALEGNRLAPVLVLTAFGSLEQRLSGFDAGAVDYMVKPFEPGELVARVRAQLDRRRLALQLHESEKLAAIGTMSAGLAHEMRNPANGIVNAVEPLLELLPPELRDPESDVGQLLSVIKDCSVQIGQLSRQLLGFRRGDDVAYESLPANRLVERALGMLRPALKDIDLRLDLRYPGPLTCAPTLLLQVLTNLLENAVHAAGRGGWITIATFADGDRFVCEVGDSGAGVPVQLRERIFEPFFTTKAAGEGTGLGLSTSRQIVDRHRGRLFVRAAEVGTVFRFELPLPQGGALAGPRMSA